ncbi:hypothetical protein PPL_11279 [Heterostelium album PN500]|uniref:Uncharacterized protein n=1 Tax=Heterostelium pallidum (strain ATCC 26659 / Pp 5 / PN500) TaxID=670386 RepID=D3BU19_HETP5|nr:hypothetical protein PPL_11279 [Heterostelium album PN500]EFA75205.1 hypothetical protein PPL_11279 [Heterostelium album PN500]|eukprot:XP_020427339.1 hypothetical protein PPL_11279 [Heterostelium album PN500]
MQTLSFLLQQKILTYLMSNGIPSTLKEYIVPYIRNLPKSGHKNSDLFRKINLNSSHVELSLVCKNWFKFISIQTNRIYLKLKTKYNSNIEYYFELPGSRKQDSQYSLYNKQNIHTLYLGAWDTIHYEGKYDIEFKETIDSLPNLERLIIITNNPYLLLAIHKQYPSLKIEVHVEDHQFFSYKKDIDLSFVEFIHSYAIHVVHADLSKYYQFVKAWRTNSLELEYGCLGEQHFRHISYSFLLELQSLQHLLIHVDHIDAKELVLVAKNNILESFSSDVFFRLFMGFSRKEWCRCVDFLEKGDDSDDDDRGDNNGLVPLKYWRNFCLALATNTKLKYLHLGNTCKHKRLSNKLTTFISSEFLTSLKANGTLESLSLSCNMLSDDFYESLFSQSNTDTNRTIKSIHLRSYNLDRLKSIGRMLEHNQTINHLTFSKYINSKDENNSDTNQAIDSFVSSLALNKTLISLTIAENTFTTDLLSKLSLSSTLSFILTKKDPYEYYGEHTINENDDIEDEEEEEEEDIDDDEDGDEE